MGHWFICEVVYTCLLLFLLDARVKNNTAHALVKFALSNVDFVWIEECPPCILSIVA